MQDDNTTKPKRHARGSLTEAEKKAYQKQWREDNKEYKNSQDAEYRRTHSVELKASRAANKDKENAQAALYREEHREELRAKDRTPENRKRKNQWKKNNPDKVKTGRRNYEANNRDKMRTKTRNRRARRDNAEGHHTQADIDALWTKQHHECAVPGCQHPISDQHGKHHYHVDHIRAIINGGSNWPWNLQILCGHCNSKKHDEDEYEWAQRELGTLFVK